MSASFWRSSGSTRMFAPSGSSSFAAASAAARASAIVVGAELDHQPRLALAEQRDRMIVVAMLRLDPTDQHVVHRFAADRLQRARDVRRRGDAIDVGIAEHRERACRFRRHQRQRRAEDHHARRFAADERAADVEALVGEQVRQVVAGDPSRHVRELGADLRLVAIAQIAQRLIDPRALAAILRSRARAPYRRSRRR